MIYPDQTFRSFWSSAPGLTIIRAPPDNGCCPLISVTDLWWLQEVVVVVCFGWDTCEVSPRCNGSGFWASCGFVFGGGGPKGVFYEDSVSVLVILFKLKHM